MAERVQKSQRFTRAARAERDRLARRRSQLFKRREDAQVKLDALDEELEAVDQEISALEGFALTSVDESERSTESSRHDADPKLLGGAAIRIIAVRLLMSEQASAPIHYRDWLDLLNREGFTVAGKRPDAVFLNQVARSPLVRATTKAGYYALDLSAGDQLRSKLRELQAELARRLKEIPGDADEFAANRERQRELNIAIARTERELNEAMSVISGDQQDLHEAPASFQAKAA
jgi:predicted nuclease with TOPRIM domain